MPTETLLDQLSKYIILVLQQLIDQDHYTIYIVQTVVALDIVLATLAKLTYQI